MAVDVLLGLQWGDEGKGKIVDVIAPEYDIIARFQGGPNAGHTIEFNGNKYVLHLIPSGIFHEGKDCLIGNGVVLDPAILKKEVEKLEQAGLEVRPKLMLSKRAHIIVPSHRLLDAAYEAEKGEQKIGSTLKGIGPTYTDKYARMGLRVGDLESNAFEEKYRALRQRHSRIFEGLGFGPENWDELEKDFFEAIEFIRSLRLVNSENFIQQSLDEGKNILAEGAQGTLLDVDFGSYPFVTSSNTISAGACTGLGVSPRQIRNVIGVFKAYCTRVGSGPFPTELDNELGESIRKMGHEFGATTGRPRRTGWIDMPLLRYAVRLNGVTDLVMTKADVLSGQPEIFSAHAYHYDGQQQMLPPYSLNPSPDVEWKTFDGWDEDLTEIRSYDQLPKSLTAYADYLQNDLQAALRWISVGPDREQMIRSGSKMAIR